MPTFREITGFQLVKEDYENVKRAMDITNKVRQQRMMPPYDFNDFLRVLMRSGFSAWGEAFKNQLPGEEHNLIVTPEQFRDEVLGARAMAPGHQGLVLA